MTRENDLYDQLKIILPPGKFSIPDKAAAATAEDWNNTKQGTQRGLYNTYLDITEAIERNKLYQEELGTVFSDTEKRLTLLEDKLINGLTSGIEHTITETFASDYDFSSTVRVDTAGQLITLGVNQTKAVNNRTLSSNVSFNGALDPGTHIGIGQIYGLSSADETDDLRKADTSNDIIVGDPLDIEKVIRLNINLSFLYDPAFDQTRDQSTVDMSFLKNFVTDPQQGYDVASQQFSAVEFDWKDLSVENDSQDTLDIVYALTLNPPASVSLITLDQEAVFGEFAVLYRVTVETENGKTYTVHEFEDKKASYTHALTGDKIRIIRWFFRRKNGYRLPVELTQYHKGPLTNNRIVLSL